MFRFFCAMTSIALIVATGCRSVEKTLVPSQYRDWTPEQAVLPTVEFHGNRATVHNIRNCKYVTEDVYLVDYYDKTFDLANIRSVDFVMIPFEDMPSLAHTMLSFEFARDDGGSDYLAVSVETRKERDETYTPWKGSARQYELMYVVADERDVIGLRANYRGEQVYLYDTTATPEAARMLFVDVMGRVNEIASRPEFYDTLTNNCTTNIVRHINRIKPNRIAYDLRVVLPGYSDQLAYDAGLIQRRGSFEETKRHAYINPLAARYAGREDFSQAIRRR